MGLTHLTTIHLEWNILVLDGAKTRGVITEATKVVKLVLHGTLYERDAILLLLNVSLALPVRLHFISADVLKLAPASALLP